MPSRDCSTAGCRKGMHLRATRFGPALHHLNQITEHIDREGAPVRHQRFAPRIARFAADCRVSRRPKWSTAEGSSTGDRYVWPSVVEVVGRSAHGVRQEAGSSTLRQAVEDLLLAELALVSAASRSRSRMGAKLDPRDEVVQATKIDSKWQSSD